MAALRAASAASGVTAGVPVVAVADAAAAAVIAAASVISAAMMAVANAQARKPWAVSRKNTSSVRTPTHFLRNRPAK